MAITSEQFRSLRGIINIHSVLKAARVHNVYTVYNRVFVRRGCLTVEESAAITATLRRAGLQYVGVPE
jgi:hypothetical protein